MPIETALDLGYDFERVKWFLWHGNIFKALQAMKMIVIDLGMLQDFLKTPTVNKLLKAASEFEGYIYTNQSFLPNFVIVIVTVRLYLPFLWNPQSIKLSASDLSRSNKCAGHLKVPTDCFKFIFKS